MEEEKQTKTEEKTIKKIRCTYCNSGFVYFKLREKIWQCRNCGKSFTRGE